ncbi:hypothetical protein QUF74_07130 [Candidatus Halobeggiatoa sp. HSG11]|nr:hypothetical protein [Candidatus Halobeggiatoa sp. HSG11]
MNKKMIAGIIFISILISSLILSWVINRSPEPINNDSESAIKVNPKETIIKIPKPVKKPPPPDVYWSEFNKSLLDLEQEHMEILRTITPTNTKPVIRKITTTQKVTKTTPQTINWGNVGKNLLELEQLRKNIIKSLKE